jgi:hypothetical protein
MLKIILLPARHTDAYLFPAKAVFLLPCQHNAPIAYPITVWATMTTTIYDNPFITKGEHYAILVETSSDIHWHVRA